MKTARDLWNVLTRREILSVCLVAFAADLVSGVTVPTFSLYATSLGASLALVGALTGTAGVSSIFASVPIGALSDARGRKAIIATGMLLFALSSFLYTVVPTPWLFFPIRILTSLATVAVFMVGVAYIADVTTRAERGLALGLYSTAMALGFTIGPAIGGLLASRFGYDIAYRGAAVIGLLGFLVAVYGLAGKSPDMGSMMQEASRGPVLSLLAKFRLMVQKPGMLAACLANLGNSVAFATIFSFLPLYAVTLSIGDAALGSMFAARGIASTFSRIPTGMLTERVSGRSLMIAGLALSTVTMLVLATTSSSALLWFILIGDGVAYGVFLTAGQSYVTELSAEGEQGSAIGIYSTAGSIGAALGPIVMGTVAEWIGLKIVFLIAATLAAGVSVNLWRSRRAVLVHQ